MTRALPVLFAALATACSASNGDDPIADPLAHAGAGKADGGGLEVRRWESATNVFAAQLGDVDASYDANNCELFVNGFGRGNFSNGGASASWLEAWISVPPQEGEILGVGMFVRTGTGDADFVMLGREVEPDYWLTGFTLSRTSPAESHEAAEVAFFVEREHDGEVLRLWQSAHGADFDVADTFAAPPSSTVGIGGGAISYAGDRVALFDQRRACQ